MYCWPLLENILHNAMLSSVSLTTELERCCMGGNQRRWLEYIREPTACDQFSLHYYNHLFICCCRFRTVINLFVSLNFIYKWFSCVSKPANKFPSSNCVSIYTIINAQRVYLGSVLWPCLISLCVDVNVNSSPLKLNDCVIFHDRLELVDWLPPTVHVESAAGRAPCQGHFS